MTFETDVLIVGGGLAGLNLARMLHEEGIDFHLVEARSRFGGRIKTEWSDSGYYDLGPTWFWDGQPRIQALVKELNLTIFNQHSEGGLIFEGQNGEIRKGQGASSMAGSYRLVGGLGQLTDTLAHGLKDERVDLNSKVTEIHETLSGINAVLETVNGFTKIQAKTVVLAIPPRVVCQQIKFEPALPLLATQTMDSIATWMAGHAKVVAVYNSPFWREGGLSGDAISHRGPMVEIHDASPCEGGPFALFGFIGVSVHARADKVALRYQILKQLNRLFGPKAENPKELFLKDWADDIFTTTDLDHTPVYVHPNYGMPQAFRGLMNGKVLMGSTEVATYFGGYIEGALEVSENTLKDILQSKMGKSA